MFCKLTTVNTQNNAVCWVKCARCVYMYLCIHMVFLPVYSSQIVKGVKTAAGIPLTDSHMEICCKEMMQFRCLYQTVMSKYALNMLQHFVLFRAHLVTSRPVFGLFRCLWSMLHPYFNQTTPEFIWKRIKTSDPVLCASRFGLQRSRLLPSCSVV